MIRGELVADFPFQYPTSVKLYQFRDTEKNWVLEYPQLNKPTNKK